MRIPKSYLVCPHPKNKNHTFSNINPTIVIDTLMEKFSRVLCTVWEPKFIFIKKNALGVSAVVFCEQFLAYTLKKV